MAGKGLESDLPLKHCLNFQVFSLTSHPPLPYGPLPHIYFPPHSQRGHYVYFLSIITLSSVSAVKKVRETNRGSKPVVYKWLELLYLD